MVCLSAVFAAGGASLRQKSTPRTYWIRAPGGMLVSAQHARRGAGGRQRRPRLQGGPDGRPLAGCRPHGAGRHVQRGLLGAPRASRAPRRRRRARGRRAGGSRRAGGEQGRPFGTGEAGIARRGGPPESAAPRSGRRAHRPPGAADSGAPPGASPGGMAAGAGGKNARAQRAEPTFRRWLGGKGGSGREKRPRRAGEGAGGRAARFP